MVCPSEFPEFGPGFICCAPQCDDDFIKGILGQDLFQFIDIAEDIESIDIQAAEEGVVIQDANDFAFVLLLACTGNRLQINPAKQPPRRRSASG